MLLSEGEKEPSMLEDIQNCAEVPEWRDNKSDIVRDTFQFFVEGGGVFDMLDRVRAESVLELIWREWKFVDAVDHNKVGNVSVFDDVDIHATTIRFAATDVEIPLSSAVANDSPHNAITEEVEGRKEDDEDCAGDE